jgi:lysophospholipase L1-like esterase
VVAAAAAKAIRALSDAGIPVVVVLPVPEAPGPVAECVAHHRVSQCERRHPHAVRAQRDAVTAPFLDAIGDLPGVSTFDPFDVLCSARACAVTAGDRVLYIDDSHLSADGARQLAPELLPVLRAAIG